MKTKTMTIVCMLLVLNGCATLSKLDPCKIPGICEPPPPPPPVDPPVPPVEPPVEPPVDPQIPPTEIPDRPELTVPLNVEWAKDERIPPARFQFQVNQAIQIELPHCYVNSDCRVPWTDQEFIALVARRLRGQFGFWAGQHELGADNLVVGDSQWSNQNYHIYNYGGGKVVWDSYHDTWHAIEQPPVVDPSQCPDGVPNATKGLLSYSWNRNRTVAWVDWTPKVKASETADPEYCKKTHPNNSLQWGTCALTPEGVLYGRDCAYKHGKPEWFMMVTSGGWAPIGSDEGDAFHIHAPPGSRVKACLEVDRNSCAEVMITP